MVRLPQGDEGREVIEKYGGLTKAAALAAAPFIFQLIEWCGLLSVLLYVHEKTQSPVPLVLYWIALVSLFPYIAYRLDGGAPAFTPWAQVWKRSTAITGLISFAATAATWWATVYFAGLFAANRV